MRMRGERAAAVYEYVDRLSCAGADENKTPPQQPARESLTLCGPDAGGIRPPDIDRYAGLRISSILLKYQHESIDSYQEI